MHNEGRSTNFVRHITQFYHVVHGHLCVKFDSRKTEDDVVMRTRKIMEIGEVAKSKTLARSCNKKGHDRDRTKELELRSTTLIIQSHSFLFYFVEAALDPLRSETFGKVSHFIRIPN